MKDIMIGNIKDKIIYTPEQYQESYINTNFVRQEELINFLTEMKKVPYGKFVIYGAPGMGKTTFLHMIENELEKNERKVVWIKDTFSVNNRGIIYDDFSKNTIFFIDGFDNARNKKHLLREIIEKDLSCICTSREKINDINFDMEMKLDGLSMDEVFQLIDRRFGALKLDDNGYIKDIIFKVKDGNLSPQNIMLAISHYFRDAGLMENFFFDSPDGIYQSYVYGKGLDLICPKILLPKHNSIIVPSEIRNDIKVINKSLVDEIARNPEVLYQLTPREFEETVCELFEKRGYRVKLTKQTRDGGKDIIILNNSILGDMVFYAECKKYAPKHPVGVGLVRELYGTVSADRATAGILVTSSYFTDEARRFRGKIKAQMKLMDYSELIKEIQNGVN